MNIQYSGEQKMWKKRRKNKHAKGGGKTERTNKKTYGVVNDHRVDTPGTKKKKLANELK